MLFGLGGIGLAKNPEGFLVDTAEEFRKLDRKHRGRAGTAEVRRRQPATGRQPPRRRIAPIPTTRRTESTPPASAAVAGWRAAATGALLQVRGLRAGYDGVEVLHGIDFDVQAGLDRGGARPQRCRQDHAVLGHHRPGRRPTAGTVILDGVELHGRPPTSGRATVWCSPPSHAESSPG